MNRIPALPAIVAGVVALIVLFSSLYTVQQTQQALVRQFGRISAVVTEPGLHVKVPFLQSVMLIDKRILELDSPVLEVIAADKKRLVVDAFARFRIVDPVEFYQSNNQGSEEAARDNLLKSLRSALRDVVGRAPFSDILSQKRADMMIRIRDIMDAEAKSLGMDVVDVRIRRADLPQANSQAVFQRMQTERQQEAAGIRATGEERSREIRASADKNVTILIAEARRDSEIMRGLGDGCRNNIYAQAYGADPDFFAFYRSMQAYERALKAEGTTLVLSPSSDFFRYFGRLDGAGGGPRSFAGGGGSIPARGAGNSCDRAFAAIAAANVSSASGMTVLTALAEITPGATRTEAIDTVARKAALEDKVDMIRRSAESSSNAQLRAEILAALARNTEPAAASTPAPAQKMTPSPALPSPQSPKILPGKKLAPKAPAPKAAPSGE